MADIVNTLKWLVLRPRSIGLHSFRLAWIYNSRICARQLRLCNQAMVFQKLFCHVAVVFIKCFIRSVCVSFTKLLVSPYQCRIGVVIIST